jgi:hypothetical protein
MVEYIPENRSFRIAIETGRTEDSVTMQEILLTEEQLAHARDAGLRAANRTDAWAEVHREPMAFAQLPERRFHPDAMVAPAPISGREIQAGWRAVEWAQRQAMVRMEEIYMGVDSDAPRIDQHRKASERAHALLKSLLSLSEQDELDKNGSITVRGASGTAYTIHAHTQTEIFARPQEKIAQACLQLTIDAPVFDRMTAEYLLLKNDERQYWNTANIFSAEGGPPFPVLANPVLRPPEQELVTLQTLSEARQIGAEFRVGDTIRVRRPRPWRDWLGF